MTMDTLILKENLKIQSILFNKTSDDSIFSFSKEEFDYEKYSFENIESNFNSHYNCNPDGWLLYLDKKFQEKSIKLIKKIYKKAFKDNKLNFTNGAFSESILFYRINSGLIIELLDPECFSEFFEDLVEELSESLSEKITNEFDLIKIPFCHIQSNFSTLIEMDEGKVFLDILKKNDVLRITS